MKKSMLRNLLLLDAAVLLLLGAFMIVVPGRVAQFFHFSDLPATAHYMIGLWGCALGTMGGAYVFAAMNPIQNRLWIQVGIARGALETFLGVFYLASGGISFAQGGFGTALAALMTVAYLALYPRKPRVIPSTETPAAQKA